MYTYTAKVLSKIEYPSGGWEGLKVGVFRIIGEKEEQIGEYERNYSPFFNTFYPFNKDEKEYALYSPDYTATRILELPSCKDIGGEERNSWGFCPTDYYVPSYLYKETVSTTGGENKVSKYLVNEPEDSDLQENTYKYTTNDGNNVEILTYPTTPRLYYPFGFIAGCIWGDDSSWKIQYLDLSEVEKGVIKRDDRFGYIKLPEHLTLKQAIDMTDYNYDPEENYYQIKIAIQKDFDLRTGKIIDEDSFE